MSLMNLGGLYHSIGDDQSYDKAVKAFSGAKEIRGRILGTHHRDYATAVEKLARVYKSMGLHGKAEPLLAEVQEIQAKQGQ